MGNEIQNELSRQREAAKSIPAGPISRMASRYTLESDHLLGLLLKLGFEESHFATCDAWKRNCGGVPRGSFVLFKLDPRAVDPEDVSFCDRLILARVTNSAPTPVEGNVQQTLFHAHKLQAQLDPLTHQEFQWGALKASVVGTFFDEGAEIGFGNDVDTFFSSFAYVAYMPSDDDLTVLINSFVKTKNPTQIGKLRYTETPSPTHQLDVPIYIDPRDIVGEPTSAQRLANFGKTRFGKSNSNKVISQSIFESGLDVSQVFFDPSGEYTYINDQDGTSLYAMFPEGSVRYSLAPKEIRQDERKLGLKKPRLLSINFYEYPTVGHSLIVSLWSTENSGIPGYMRPVLDWSPEDPSDCPDRQDRSGFNHFWRTMGLWYALLYKAGFTPPPNLRVPITFRRAVKTAIVAAVPESANDSGDFNENGLPISILPEVYRCVARVYKRNKDSGTHFPVSNGNPYFNDVEEKLLQMFDDSKSWTAHNYIRPFNKYHSPEGSSIFDEISEHVASGKSVFVDMSQSNEVVRNNLVDRICRSIFDRQNRKFNSDAGIGERIVLFYFEEAHRLFSRDDKDLNSIYNLLAKEGAKLNIAMIYSTQSMTTISPDLLKNTDNFLIAHLDDDREAREVGRKFAFRDMAEDVMRIQSKGFVRMITRSHRFALPVQINRFRPLTPDVKAING